ncbi:DUF2218 domain-containing protein [Streptomyces sp. NBC_00038]|uniref:DUF2218 domain-containing protein n=1 Tax=Streptomyces sp. NBC_00038 TaxID=2903615 RepID=UPI00225576BD|nr:DUF2218 domain-containing protein [Streptomyces sp. NBC_00038]MCX5555774.1 DUF2218 domain-containing protein [Streptomyces sp. NBC_00038]
MPITEAHIETDRPGRYLVQLCRHFSNKGRHLGHRPRTRHGGETSAGTHASPGFRPDEITVEWSETHGMLDLPWGRCAMRADPGTLTLRIEAADEEDLRRFQDLLTAHISRFSRRAPLSVDWRRPEEPAVQPDAARPVPEKTVAHRRWHRGWTGFGVACAVIVAMAVHLGLGGAVLAGTQWTGWAIGFIATAIVVKIAVLSVFAVRHGPRRTD